MMEVKKMDKGARGHIPAWLAHDIGRLRKHFPMESPAIGQLHQLIKGSPGKYTLGQLVDRLGPSDQVALVQILEALVGVGGWLGRHVQVISPVDGSVAGRFNSLLDVPDLLGSGDGAFEVTMDDIQVIYEVRGPLTPEPRSGKMA